MRSLLQDSSTTDKRRGGARVRRPRRPSHRGSERRDEHRGSVKRERVRTIDIPYTCIAPLCDRLRLVGERSREDLSKKLHSSCTYIYIYTHTRCALVLDGPWLIVREIAVLSISVTGNHHRAHNRLANAHTRVARKRPPSLSSPSSSSYFTHIYMRVCT